MSQEDLDVARAALAALQESARLGEPTEALLAICRSDIHVDATRRVFNPETYDGREGIGALVREMREAWEGFTHVPERLVEADGRILAIHTIEGRGSASGVQASSRSALIFTIRDGRVSAVEAHSEPDEALRAVGLEP